MQPPAPSNRRMAPRCAVVVQVSLQSEHNFYMGLTQDLSRGGLFVATHNIREIGERIHLRFTLPGSPQPIDALTEVRWVRPRAIEGGGGEAGMGLQFIELPLRARDAVFAFLRQRESLFFDVD